MFIGIWNFVFDDFFLLMHSFRGFYELGTNSEFHSGRAFFKTLRTTLRRWGNEVSLKETRLVLDICVWS